MKRILPVVLVLFLLLALVLPVHAGDARITPEVYDLSGVQRDLAWLQARYGDVSFSYGTGTHFVLERVDATVGPATLVVRVLQANGLPAPNQPVALSWPGIPCGQPDPNIRPLDATVKTRLSDCAIVQRTDSTGYTGFGLSTDWYYRDRQAPGIVWVLSPSVQSDGAYSIGMLGKTEHEGPLSFTFQLEEPVPPTPLPVPTVIPTPVPQPTIDLTETNGLLQKIVDALHALNTTLREAFRLG